MIFSSLEFIYVFLPITCALFLIARKTAGMQVAISVLTLASFVYYGYWRLDYFAILVASILFNFAVSRGLEKNWFSSRTTLSLGIAGNLGLLFWFKYAAFASTIAVDVGLLSTAFAAKALPLGISFFTFQQIAYLVDRARGLAPPLSLLRHALFVSFFPQLIAGPIVHHSEMMPQLERPRPSASLALLGCFVFAIGLAKKAVLADSLGILANAGFADPASLAFVNAWAVTLAYTFQLYFDFSGYSDMAIGLGLLFGIRLPWNFLSPYKSCDLSEFWRRWHITLSRFLRDYLYIPLGGSREGDWKTSRNLFVTMVLGGIWHGAGWTFVVWGTLHGSILILVHLFQRSGRSVSSLLSGPATFLVVVLGWVLFRAETMSDAMTMLSNMFGGAEAGFAGGDATLARALPFLAVSPLLVFLAPNTRQLSERFRATPGWILLGCTLIALAMIRILGQLEPPEFLYFDF